MEELSYILPDDIDIYKSCGLSDDIERHFSNVPKIAMPLKKKAEETFNKIEQLLYTLPAFISTIKACIPEHSFQAILSDEQQKEIASGALKLMTKKDGTLMANLINPETKKIVSTIPLEQVNLSPDLLQSIATFSSQMQMAQLSEQIQKVQEAIEEVRRGQEFDRLATAYSCQQKYLQALEFKNPELKTEALMRIAMDAEDSRNLLMLSQKANLEFIYNQPETDFGKFCSKTKQPEIDKRINEIRDGLLAINMVSLTEALAYQEMGENTAAKQSLQYYSDFVQNAYLSKPKLIERLDLLDKSPLNYWSKELPQINNTIKKLNCTASTNLLIGEEKNE